LKRCEPPWRAFEALRGETVLTARSCSKQDEIPVRTVDSVSQTLQTDSKEEGALQLAAISLMYVQRTGKLDDLRQYYQEFFDPSFKVKVSHDFATQEEADTWISSGKGTHGELVRIGGQGFQVVQFPKGSRFLRTPLPEERGPPKSE
jgi:hypothetical protein